MDRVLPFLLAQMTFPLVALGLMVLAALAIIIAVVVYNYGSIFIRAYTCHAPASAC